MIYLAADSRCRHETTSSALTWAIFLLSKHVDTQDRLRKECQEACGRLDPSEVNAEVIDSLHFLEAGCNEVLRIYPSAPITSRAAVRETRVGNAVIPKGTYACSYPVFHFAKASANAPFFCPDMPVNIPIWALNHLPSLWGQDADEFRPDRWMGPDGKHGGATSPYAFMTFLYGPRGCIGQSFARNELKCLLTALLIHFELRLKNPDEVPVPEGAVTIMPRDGLEIIVRPL